MPTNSATPKALQALTFCLAALLFSSAAFAGEWTHWRGPHQTGVSEETGLIATWSRDGENLVWRQDFVGRSTPVVVDGRVCANGRSGEGINRQEAIACWSTESGELLWQRNFNVYATFVPWNRVGWGTPVADAETGNVYLQFVDGRFGAFDKDGNTVWMWRLGEDFGRSSGYGGRTNTPVVDENRVIAHVIGSSFGANVGLGDRWVAFDKKTGEILWVSDKFAPPKDLNTYSSPIIAVVDGRRQVIAGGASGKIVGLDARTGETLWTYHLSQRGLNGSVAIDGTTVVAAHSEENIDSGIMGRVVAFDIAGAAGDITTGREVWRKDGLQAGYVSPAIHDGMVYIADNSANLHAINLASGEQKWEANYGTVGKASPVVADGRIYITEVNGNVVILDLESGEELNKVHLEVPDGRYAEIYGSVAVANQRVYLVSEEGIYALGDKAQAYSDGPVASTNKFDQDPAPEGAAPATLQIVPNAVVTMHDQQVDFRVLAFDAMGRSLGEVSDVKWSVDGIAGSIDSSGVLSFDGSKIAGTRNGKVHAAIGELTGSAEVRVAGPLPWQWDFDDTPEGKPPHGWFGVGKGAQARSEEGAEGKILVQPRAPRGAPRAFMYFGPTSMSEYTVQADIRGNKKGRRYTDAGVVNNGYYMDLQGAHQRIQLLSWGSERRMMKQFPFPWESGIWYTLKLRVDHEGDGDARQAIIRGKIWKRGEPEPEAWTVEAEDPLPIETGAPGIYTYAPMESYFDNVMVTPSK